MPIYSDAVRNTWANQNETVIGASPILRIYGGAVPNNVDDAPGGAPLAEINLPADWLGAAAAGVVNGANMPWSTSSADNTGTATFYRIYDNGDTTCHEQGTVTASAGGGDMELDNTSINAGQTVLINTYVGTTGNKGQNN